MDILVCLEGSPSSGRAINLAIELARSLPANLVGLAIIDEPDIVSGAATSIGGASFKKERDTLLLDDARSQARAWLSSFVARGKAAGIAVRGIEATGRPAEAILSEVPEHDLIMLGRQVNFRFETQDDDRYTRDRILRRAGKPILVVPESAPAPGLAAIVAYDGSAAAGRALRSFATSGLARGRAVHVVTVADDGADAFETASRGCALLDKLGVRAVPDNLVSTESTAGALLLHRARISAGMIAIGGYIPSSLARLVWGSVTQAVVEHAAVPVFLHY
jgi:nucleotide-binding universal stress UspA family protein